MATQPITSRVLNSQQQRLEGQQASQSASADQAQRTAIYDGGGNYRTVGAAGSYRPKGTVTSGGVPVGQAVPANNGLVGGMPASFGGDAQAIRDLRERLAQVAEERGLQVLTGDPNTQGQGETPLAARYLFDRYLDRDTMTLYYWQQSGANTGGKWIPVASGLDSLSGGIETPAVKQYPLITYNDEPRKIMALHLRVNADPVVVASVTQGAGASTLAWTVTQNNQQVNRTITATLLVDTANGQNQPVTLGTTILEAKSLLKLGLTGVTVGPELLSFTVQFQSAAFDLAMEEE
jgi:hypothetical protein